MAAGPRAGIRSASGHSSSSLGKRQQAGGAQLVAERPGRGGPPRDGLLAAAAALGVDRVAGRDACSGQRREPPSPRRRFRGPPAVPVPGCWSALGALAGPGLLLLLPHPGGPPRNGSGPAEQLQQHGQQVTIGLRRQPGGAGLRSFSAVLSEKAGISPSGGQPVPAQGVPCRRVGGSWKNTCRRSRRSSRITHVSLCCPPRPDGLPSYGFSTGSALPYQSPPILTPRSRGSSPGGRAAARNSSGGGPAGRTRPGSSRRRTACSGCAPRPAPRPVRAPRVPGAATPDNPLRDKAFHPLHGQRRGGLGVGAAVGDVDPGIARQVLEQQAPQRPEGSLDRCFTAHRQLHPIRSIGTDVSV